MKHLLIPKLSLLWIFAKPLQNTEDIKIILDNMELCRKQKNK